MQENGLVFSVRPQNRFQLDDAFLAAYATRPTGMTTIGEVTFLRTYAQRVEAEDRLEKWWEVCRRVVEYTISVLVQQVRASGQYIDLPAMQKLAQTMYARMFDRKWLPPGRGIQFMGTRAVELKGGAVLNNCGMRSTENLHVDFAEPFCDVMDFLMLGVGMGFDTRGAGKVVVQKPDTDPMLTFVVEDSREGWVDALRHTLNAYVGKNPLCSGYDFSKIREEGAILKTFGGTASGYKPLAELLFAVRRILDARIGQPIRSVDIADIANYVGRCVVAGNIRRSAEIALGDPNDPDFIALKDPARLIEISMEQARIAQTIGGWVGLQKEIDSVRALQKSHSVLSAEYGSWQDLIDMMKADQDELLAQNPEWTALQAEADAHPLATHRWASNNTVVCDVGQDYATLSDMTVRNGEPGYVWLDVARKYGRLADPPTDADERVCGTNPCVPGNTRILTRNGYQAIEALVGQRVDVWNGEFWAPVTPRVTGHDQPLVTVTLTNGRALTCTEYHEWILADDTRIRAKDLTPSTRLKEFAMPPEDSLSPSWDLGGPVTVYSVVPAGTADTVYCFEEPLTHRGTFEGIVTGQCGEQQLEDMELCTLVETFPTRCDDLEDWKATLKVAFLYAKVVTLIPTHNPRTNAVIARNRRIGTSMAGVFELYERLGLRGCAQWWDDGYAYICKLDRSYSGWMGVPQSVKKTSVKPGGTVPLLADVEGGMKVPTAVYYMRTIRLAYDSPLVPSLRAAGYRVEDDRRTPRTVVAYFPCHNTRVGRTAKDVSLWEQAALFTALQRHWSDNMVSATLTFQAHEAPDVRRVIEAYEGQWKGVSFLPLFDHAYPQAPYIPCSKEEYEAAAAKIRPLDASGVQHDAEEKYCSGALCEMKAAG